MKCSFYFANKKKIIGIIYLDILDQCLLFKIIEIEQTWHFHASCFPKNK